MNVQLLNELASLASEARNPDTLDIDLLSSEEILTKINNADREVPEAVYRELPNITRAVDAIAEAFKSGARLIYMGAGTSGRLGILDAVECPPTFGVSEDMVVALIAGGEEAIYRAQEGAEDSLTLGGEDLRNINLSENDVVVGIAASGRTPYVIGGLRYARALGCTTIAVSCNKSAAIAEEADIAILPEVGPEILTGSTRMKAGTAQKLVLNMLTTASMIRIGKSFYNLMVDVKATNEKLVSRTRRIVMETTGVGLDEADRVLQSCDHNAKLAIMMILSGLERSKAEEALAKSQGFLRRALQEIRDASDTNTSGPRQCTALKDEEPAV
ncbi:N-acetylmuramic acid 6-phosphate etherase [Microbulbifer hydrolyticus]|uniref:N-acetylmuramic acid 6-phosphate etherase n=1 Tax=Microbulbifer hydrolyticus TaxID=48074 RepID=A0A6P1T7N0_9GAMM|nr:N-acetylmuramic acid 6-phosphate etherase [Microbulbifer hydrolyticus]MBB5210750.1 N-acetylmuramic acid 6-phosphate etherase [Microbulbifer hydrolyticus]QHQ38804.1 N-acetylmuramic acid 6-phosphate etherase [Microbulbifer hydrolyticus]